MADEYYNSPGSAAFDSLQNMMTLQAQQKHQALVDMLAMRREDRDTQQHQADLELKREQLKASIEDRAQRRAEAQSAITDKARERDYTETSKSLDRMSPGDFLTPKQLADTKRLGIPVAMQPNGQVMSAPSTANTSALPGAQPAPSMSDVPGGPAPAVGPQQPPPPVVLPGAQPSMALPLVGGYAGNQQQRQSTLDEARIQEVLNHPNITPGVKNYLTTLMALPESVRKGVNPPASLFEKPAPTADKSEPVFRQNAKKGTVERLVDGQWVTWTGNAPEHAHWMTEPQPQQDSGHYQLQPEVDKDGKQTGRFFSFDTRGNSIGLVKLPEGGGPAATKAAPGASQLASQSANKETALHTVSRAEQDIQDADAAGLLGPASGRWYTALAKVGTTGDPAKDRLIGRIKGDLLLMKMHVDAGIGGTRAAASPLLLKNWDELAMKSSKDLLLGYTSGIKDDLKPSGGSPDSAAAPRIRVYDPATGTLK